VALDHIIVSGSGELSGAIDHMLEVRGLKRRVIAAVPQFIASLATVAASDAIASVPLGVAQLYAPLFKLETHPFPLPLPASKFVAVRARQRNGDRAVEWLIGMLKGDDDPVSDMALDTEGAVELGRVGNAARNRSKAENARVARQRGTKGRQAR
jgi:DNA-binding transcriptional LysR family regulator